MSQGSSAHVKFQWPIEKTKYRDEYIYSMEKLQYELW